MNDNGWLNFVNSGSVSDYLKYKEQERQQSNLTDLKGKNDGGFHKGFSNKRTVDRGE
ncbi:MAG: hypothetical protein PUE08_04935 [Eubacteriales bacterium]|nr:hypothetical protein [Eubacteriales bacterium]